MEPAKGERGGKCNRTVCSSVDAQWYNISTQKYYCAGCAALINVENDDALCHLTGPYRVETGTVQLYVCNDDSFTQHFGRCYYGYDDSREEIGSKRERVIGWMVCDRLNEGLISEASAIEILKRV